jgi:DNA polymerase IV
MFYIMGIMPRKILHLDLDAFFCSVEENHDPSLRGKPFIVGGHPEGRGVVASASYPARMCGVRSAMPTGRAMRLCPDLLIVHGHYAAYQTASEAVMEHLMALTPLVEQISIDEAFLDVSDLPQSGLEIARAVQHAIWDDLALPCSVGVAANKLVAKMATDAGKHSCRGKPEPPRTILVVPPGEEAAFLAPLPVDALWGVGPKTKERLLPLGIHTIGDILRLSERQLTKAFGKMGPELRERAQGIDDRPVVITHEAKSISQEVTFDRNRSDRQALLGTLRRMTEQVCTHLRRDSLAGSTVRIKLRWSDFTTITRQVSLPEATDVDGVVYANALALFDQAWTPGRPVRLIGVGVSGLTEAMRQLPLWETPSEKEHRLLEAIDSLRDRYGTRVIQRASRLKSKDYRD